MTTQFWFLRQTPEDQGRRCYNTAKVTDVSWWWY